MSLTQRQNERDMNKVYHYTCTVKLPWILASGELRPNPTRIDGMPPDVLWATTSTQRDPTASNNLAEVLAGRVLYARVVLPASAFYEWRKIHQHNPAYTAAIKQAYEMSRTCWNVNTKHWRCRNTALASSEWLDVQVEVRNRWVSLDLTQPVARADDHTLGVQVGDQVYFSSAFQGPDSNTGYRTYPPFCVADVYGDGALVV